MLFICRVECYVTMYVLMVCELILVVSYMINISSTSLVLNAKFFVSSWSFMFVSSKFCKNISAIRPKIGDPMAMPRSGW